MSPGEAETVVEEAKRRGAPATVRRADARPKDREGPAAKEMSVFVYYH